MVSLFNTSEENHVQYYDNAVYLGVSNYGYATSTYKDNFQHRFNIDNNEQIFTISNRDDYLIQNNLMEGEVYKLAVIDEQIQGVMLEEPLEFGTIHTLNDGTFVIDGYTSTYSIEETPIFSINNKAGGSTVTPTNIEDGKFVKVYENNTIFATTQSIPYTSPVEGIPNLRTLKNFLATAMMPVGTTLYVYGGGWDWQDVGGSKQATSIGISQTWVDFFDNQNASYSYRNDNAKASSYYPFGAYNQYYYAGLDCSGYVGWAIYNITNETNHDWNYVTSSTYQARLLSDGYDYGTWTRSFNAHDFKAGDIFSMQGHVWISLGVCDDGSILFMHSTPSSSHSGNAGGGVQLSAIGANKQCEAYLLADYYMKTYYPEWASRYSTILVSYSNYTALGNSSVTGKFSWHLDERGLLDPDGFSTMSPQQILEELFATSELNESIDI
ncbi:MAG: hypothetical protein ATN36_07610 [Epulopiscium sp. Nele67-Bin005]|nr:MAG: hypothetical protein ATN36_07610 [Epulopiscium sp. Nele67-Bin005]